MENGVPSTRKYKRPRILPPNAKDTISTSDRTSVDKDAAIQNPTLPSNSNSSVKDVNARCISGENIRDEDKYVRIGCIFHKDFDGTLFEGKVISGPESVLDDGKLISCWWVRYTDGDEEELTGEEILEHMRGEGDPSKHGCIPGTECKQREISLQGEGFNVPGKIDRNSGSGGIQKEDSIHKGIAASKALGNKTVGIGYIFFKRFEDEEFYEGKVISGPDEVEDDSGELLSSWRVKYEDNEEEDLTTQELLECPTETPQSRARRIKKERLANASIYDRALMSLLFIPGVREKEATKALNSIGPPYGLQAVMNHIQEQRSDPTRFTDASNKFAPTVGMKIRRSVGGAQYLGEVTSEGRMMLAEEGSIRMWEVTMEDGTVDDLDWYQLLQARADRPVRLNPCRGRQLCCLELFSGCGMVSQEFADRKWQVRSIDNSSHSNASDKVDIMKFEFQDIGFVPDFIWASPPCFTYSLMAAGKHRNAETKEFEKTEEALEHNHLFAKMTQVIHAAKSINPHLIFVIENPVGQMSKMPLMKELVDSMGLYKTSVDYCAFGRFDKKPTHLWTNDFGLHASLSEFRCRTKCPYRDGIHPISARKEGSNFNAAAIPDALAEEVAEYVNAKFVLDRIRYRKQGGALPPLAQTKPSVANNNGSRPRQKPKSMSLKPGTLLTRKEISNLSFDKCREWLLVIGGPLHKTKLKRQEGLLEYFDQQADPHTFRLSSDGTRQTGNNVPAEAAPKAPQESRNVFAEAEEVTL